MSNFCSTCGTQAAPGQRYCAACGASLDSSTSQETIAPPHGAGQGNPHAATRELAGRSCPYCRFPLKEGGAIATCPSCNAVHHAECYTENGGCAVAGCTAGPGHQTATAPLWAGATQTDLRTPEGVAHHAAPTAAGGIDFHQPDAAPPSPPPPGRRRMTFAIIAIVVVMVLLGGGATALLLTHKSGTTRAAATLPTAVPTDNGTTTPTETTPQTVPTQTSTDVSPTQTTPAATVPTTTTPAATTPTDTTPTATTASDPGAAALDAVNSHWQDIKNGDYNAAYQYLTPNAVNGQSQSQWVAAHNQDGIQDVQYSFSLNWVNGNQARVDISQLQTKSHDAVTGNNASGCQRWTGYYSLINQSGSWLINEDHLSPSPSC